MCERWIRGRDITHFILGNCGLSPCFLLLGEYVVVTLHFFITRRRDFVIHECCKWTHTFPQSGDLSLRTKVCEAQVCGGWNKTAIFCEIWVIRYTDAVPDTIILWPHSPASVTCSPPLHQTHPRVCVAPLGHADLFSLMMASLLSAARLPFHLSLCPTHSLHYKSCQCPSVCVPIQAPNAETTSKKKNPLSEM